MSVTCCHSHMLSHLKHGLTVSAGNMSVTCCHSHMLSHLKHGLTVSADNNNVKIMTDVVGVHCLLTTTGHNIHIPELI